MAKKYVVRLIERASETTLKVTVDELTDGAVTNTFECEFAEAADVADVKELIGENITLQFSQQKEQSDLVEAQKTTLENWKKQLEGKTVTPK